MNYPYKTDEEQIALEHMPDSPYDTDDQPHLSIARYSLTHYDPREVEEKRILDMQGVLDNAYWYDKVREDNLAVNFGQR
jgi:hypothetical protein